LPYNLYAAGIIGDDNIEGKNIKIRKVKLALKSISTFPYSIS